MFDFLKKPKQPDLVEELTTLLTAVSLIRKEANPVNQPLIIKLNQRIATIKKKLIK